MHKEARGADEWARRHPGYNATTAERQNAPAVQQLGSAAIYGGKGLYYGSKGNLLSGAGNFMEAAARVRAYLNQSGLDVNARNAAGRLLMLPPSQLADELDAYRASTSYGALSRTPFPKRGYLPALGPTLGGSYLSGGNQ
jgi:hypothetical protein